MGFVEDVFIVRRYILKGHVYLQHIIFPFLFLSWSHLRVCGNLAPQDQSVLCPLTPAVEVWSPNHWTSREFPAMYF